MCCNITLYVFRSICTEAVALCGLALEGDNADLWTTLGVTARDKGIRQHALIQALHANGDHALAWAELGQVLSSCISFLFVINQCDFNSFFLDRCT